LRNLQNGAPFTGARRKCEFGGEDAGSRSLKSRGHTLSRALHGHWQAGPMDNCPGRKSSNYYSWYLRRDAGLIMVYKKLTRYRHRRRRIINN
jgi:hypothetical protein